MTAFERLHVDQSDWGQIRVTGEDRIRFLQGMCTSNIEALSPGDWVRASQLTAKGRVVSVFDVVCRADHLLLVCEPQLASKTIESLGKYAIVDDVAFESSSAPVHRVWEDPESVWSAGPIFEPPPEPVASTEAVEVRRIEAGFPSYGVDVSEDHFPFESPLARHIDYEKGCYVGQEPVARVHARGSANKELRGLVIEGDEPVRPGMAIISADKGEVGTLSSTAVSPVFGVIAMGYVKKAAWEPGTAVTIDGRPATVRALPLVAG